MHYTSANKTVVIQNCYPFPIDIGVDLININICVYFFIDKFDKVNIWAPVHMEKSSYCESTIYSYGDG